MAHRATRSYCSAPGTPGVPIQNQSLASSTCTPVTAHMRARAIIGGRHADGRNDVNGRSPSRLSDANPPFALSAYSGHSACWRAGVPAHYLVGDTLTAVTTLTVAATGAPAPGVLITYTDGAACACVPCLKRGHAIA